jgi:hypothetical protein
MRRHEAEALLVFSEGAGVKATFFSPPFGNTSAEREPDLAGLGGAAQRLASGLLYRSRHYRRERYLWTTTPANRRM